MHSLLLPVVWLQGMEVVEHTGEVHYGEPFSSFLSVGMPLSANAIYFAISKIILILFLTVRIPICL